MGFTTLQAFFDPGRPGKTLADQANDYAANMQKQYGISYDEAIKIYSDNMKLSREQYADFANQARDKLKTGYEGATKNIKDYYSDSQNAIDTGYNSSMGDYKNALAEQQPYADVGVKSIKELADLQGLNGSDAQIAASDKLQYDPGYKFRLAQGEQSAKRGFIGNGNLLSGNTGVALQKYGQEMASDEFSKAYARLQSLSAQGQGASNARSGLYSDIAKSNQRAGELKSNLLAEQGNSLANLDTGYGTNMANSLANEGSYQGNSYANQGNALSQMRLDLGREMSDAEWKKFLGKQAGAALNMQIWNTANSTWQGALGKGGGTQNTGNPDNVDGYLANNSRQSSYNPYQGNQFTMQNLTRTGYKVE